MTQAFVPNRRSCTTPLHNLWWVEESQERVTNSPYTTTLGSTYSWRCILKPEYHPCSSFPPLYAIAFFLSFLPRPSVFLSAFLHDAITITIMIILPGSRQKYCSLIPKSSVPRLVLRMLLHVFLIINVALPCRLLRREFHTITPKSKTCMPFR